MERLNERRDVGIEVEKVCDRVGEEQELGEGDMVRALRNRGGDGGGELRIVPREVEEEERDALTLISRSFEF